MNINFYIAGILVEPPENIRELAIELNYDKDIVQPQVSTNKWRWVRENAQTIENYIKDGLTGGKGIFEGLPFKIEIELKGISRTLFDGYIDLTEETDINCNDIVVTAKEKQSIDFFNDTADSVTFEKMFSDGLIKSTNFVFVPYVISKIPKSFEAFQSIAMGAICAVQLYIEVRQIIKDIADCGGVFTTASGIIKLVLDIIGLTITLIVIIDLVINFIEAVIEPVKFHAGMFVKKLFEKGCEHFGLTFQSSIFQNENWSKLFLISEKYELSQTQLGSSIFGTLGGATVAYGSVGFVNPDLSKQQGFYKGTFGDFVRAMKTIFNAKIIIRNDLFNFERKDFNTSSVLYQIPDLRNDSYQLNTSEIKSNILISFQSDLNDKNTIDQFKGTNYQIITSPIQQSSLPLLKNLERISIPFSLAKRKNELTIPEKIIDVIISVINIPVTAANIVIKGIIDIIDAIIKIVKKVIKALKVVGITIAFNPAPIPAFTISPIVNPLTDRFGAMLLENDYIDVPKLMLINENKSDARLTKLIPDNKEFLTAKKLWDEFHFIDSFVEIEGRHNQWKKYEFKNVPFCFDEYDLIKDDNKCKSPDGKEAEIVSLKWNIWEQKADIRFKINEKYSNNLKITTFEPDGN